MPEAFPDAIAPGDLVVHLEYGIGRFVGMEERETAGRKGEVLCIAYARDAKLYVPVSNAHLVSRYHGAGDAPVKLHSLSGRRWAGEKALADAAERAGQNWGKMGPPNDGTSGGGGGGGAW